jgi:hypothetical protein
MKPINRDEMKAFVEAAFNCTTLCLPCLPNEVGANYSGIGKIRVPICIL